MEPKYDLDMAQPPVGMTRPERDPLNPDLHTFFYAAPLINHENPADRTACGLYAIQTYGTGTYQTPLAVVHGDPQTSAKDKIRSVADPIFNLTQSGNLLEAAAAAKQLAIDNFPDAHAHTNQLFPNANPSALSRHLDTTTFNRPQLEPHEGDLQPGQESPSPWTELPQKDDSNSRYLLNTMQLRPTPEDPWQQIEHTVAVTQQPTNPYEGIPYTVPIATFPTRAEAQNTIDSIALINTRYSFQEALQVMTEMHQAATGPAFPGAPLFPQQELHRTPAHDLSIDIDR